MEFLKKPNVIFLTYLTSESDVYGIAKVTSTFSCSILQRCWSFNSFIAFSIAVSDLGSSMENQKGHNREELNEKTVRRNKITTISDQS
uniref:Uncharacterized protein n=1 Tax=Romanomermis culicivorax TaxID=13658 RepID=A0A915J7E0_ROMCU